ncbi:sulfatase-like hydrolase/transferase [Coraliomargarita sp. SDUM461004]|uniref:Sulfatase-like hydrolase/transferase n=1 Tax=Thalassobacterium sedimentorum TaxID=3041258 RepID=A0ABU1AHB3_9BACT|nr:sulfatase-like hydrolase/transferase [Coraliomargarita sp. SDUM461004]MDQ8194161.1 sulfatase-like hydrolase/transferase [Coraliomargarita sp. SDUM461004]
MKQFKPLSLVTVIGTALLLSCVAALAQNADVSNSEARKPNIIFLLADDLGWGDLSCYGHPELKTPNIDQLAAGGKLFTNFYAMSSVCSPSRAAFLTGQFPVRNRVYGHFSAPEENAERGMPNWLDPSAPSYARQLQKAGYATAHFGKWHLSLPSGVGAPAPTEYGFNLSKAYLASGPQLPVAREENPYFRAQSTEAIVDETIEFIRANQGRPFYVSAWTLTPHTVLNPTDEQMAPFIDEFAPDPEHISHVGAKVVYYATVNDLDIQVGRLVAALEDLGLEKDTLIVFSSDNGPETMWIGGASHSGIGSTGPFRGRKRSLYEGGIRMPFIVSWPGTIAPGQVDRESVLAAVDLMPTFCALAGVEVPSGPAAPDGENVLPALLSGPMERSTPLFWEFHYEVDFGHVIHKSPYTALRVGDWKFLSNPGGGRVELYDIPNDPTELNNLAAYERGVTKEMQQQLKHLRAEMPQVSIEAAAGTDHYPWPE